MLLVVKVVRTMWIVERVVAGVHVCVGWLVEFAVASFVFAGICFEHTLTCLHTMRTTLIDGVFGNVECVETAGYRQRPETTERRNINIKHGGRVLHNLTIDRLVVQ